MKHGIHIFVFLLFTSCVTIVMDKARFLGTLEFVDENCTQGRRCVLKQNFGYRDPFGVSWQAPAGDETDGASIPEFLWGEVGRPFDDELIRAAVIHDFYCVNRVRTWQQTHRVFYDALITSGVSKERADLLYAGVLLGGPRWNLDGVPTDFGFKPDEELAGAPLVAEAMIDVPVTIEDVELDAEFGPVEGPPLPEDKMVIASDRELIEEDGFKTNDQPTQNENAVIISDYQNLAELIAQNPDLDPEAIANLAAQIHP